MPNKSRQDYFHLLELNNLKNDSDEFEILTTTSGRLVSDNYEFIQPIRLEENRFLVAFYVRGWRHWNNLDKGIHNLKDVYLEVDPSNQQDENAVAVKENGCTIGFIPAFYSEFIKNVLVNNINFSIKIWYCRCKQT